MSKEIKDLAFQLYKENLLKEVKRHNTPIRILWEFCCIAKEPWYRLAEEVLYESSRSA